MGLHSLLDVVDIAKQRLERLNPEWIDYQIELIRASCQFASSAGPGDRSLEGEKRTDTSTINDWERQQLFQNTAEKIIARIQSRSHFLKPLDQVGLASMS